MSNSAAVIDTKSVLPAWLLASFASPAIFANILFANTTTFESTPDPTSRQSISLALPISVFFGVPHLASTLQRNAFPVVHVFTDWVGWKTGNITLPLVSVGSAVTFSELSKWILQPMSAEVGQSLLESVALVVSLQSVKSFAVVGELIFL